MRSNISHRVKWSVFRLALVATAAVSCLAGCMSPSWPKDSHLEKGAVQVNTPWGGYTMTVEQLDTGAAARNETARVPAAPKVIAPPKVIEPKS